MTIKMLASVPRPSEKRVALHINQTAQRQIRSGHPWLFDKAITKQSHVGKPGDIAIIYDRNSKFLAAGLFDPLSPIRVRILQPRKPAQINHDWFLNKIKEAAGIRKPLLERDTDGYRLIHGENDGLPGLVVDRYAETLTLKIYTAAWVPHLTEIVESLLKILAPERIVLRINRLTQEQPEHLHGLKDGQVLFGSPLEDVVVFRENGIFFEADPVKGQKTGFFLDQRENRERVEGMAKGRDVLNVFSYTGGFSLYAARGGAKSVTSLDISKAAIEGSLRNFALNSGDKRIAAVPHHVLVGDAFEVLGELNRKGTNYGMVVIDPPSFARNQDEVPAAMNAYSKLVKLGLGVLSKGGILVMASCSSRVQIADFLLMIFDAAEEIHRPLEKIEHSEHGIDHPIGFAEGAYLKCLFAMA